MCSIAHWTTCFAVTLTMKQVLPPGALGADQRGPGYLDAQRASTNLVDFVNRLNRRVFGKAAERYGKRVRCIAVLENSEYQRLHYHLCLGPPEWIGPNEFEAAIRSSWFETHWAHRQIDIQPNADEGWLAYILKSRSKTDFDQSIDLATFHND